MHTTKSKLVVHRVHINEHRKPPQICSKVAHHTYCDYKLAITGTSNTYVRMDACMHVCASVILVNNNYNYN